MLLTRVITALVLVAVLLLTLFATSPVPFALLSLLMTAAAAWEWARLNGFANGASVASGALCAGVSALLWWAGAVQQALPMLWVVAALAWVAGGAGLLARGVAGWPGVPRALRWGLGLAVLVVAWLALAQARTIGVNFLMSVLMLVWAADVFAYFFGRALGGKLSGGRKLAPTISPGKSWEGVWGGMVGVLLVGVVWIWADRAFATDADSISLYSRLLTSGVPFWVLSSLALAAMSVVGDLLESLVKRSAGIKDSSQLLPGHGGVLDRIDALLPILPLAMLLVTWGQH